MRPLAILLFFLLHLGCGDPKHPVFLSSDCTREPGGACLVKSDGGPLEWDLSNLTPGKEYMIAIITTGKVDMRNPVPSSISITTDRPSAPISEQEARRASSFQTPGDARTKLPASTPPDRRNNNTSNPPVRNVGQEIDYYVPPPRRYDLPNSKVTTDAVIPSPKGDSFSGRTTKLETYTEVPNVFDLRYDRSVIQATTSTLRQSDAKYLEDLSTCLKRVMPKVIDLLGPPPFSLNRQNPKIGDSRVVVSLTRFDGSDGASTGGLFSILDLFATKGGRAFSESNKGEFINIAKTSNENIAPACVTAPHEYTHLLIGKYKVTNRLPPEQRYEIDTWDPQAIRRELTGTDEGLAHFIESLSEEKNFTGPVLLSTFLKDPNGTTFAPEAVLDDFTENIKSRALNLIYLYHAARLANARLKLTDPNLKRFLTSVIQSPNIGYQNIADYFHMSEEALMKSFIVRFTKVIRGAEPYTEFIPPVESTEGRMAGIEIVSPLLDRSQFVNDWPYFHPLQMKIPTLTMTTSVATRARSLNLFRYIVPNQGNSRGTLRIRAESSFVTIAVPI